MPEFAMGTAAELQETFWFACGGNQDAIGVIINDALARSGADGPQGPLLEYAEEWARRGVDPSNHDSHRRLIGVCLVAAKASGARGDRPSAIGYTAEALSRLNALANAGDPEAGNFLGKVVAAAAPLGLAPYSGAYTDNSAGWLAGPPLAEAEANAR